MVGKLEIDSQVLEATKSLILSEIKTAKENYNREADFDRKVMIEATINNLRIAYSNLVKHANEPGPIRKMFIGKKR